MHLHSANRHVRSAILVLAGMIAVLLAAETPAGAQYGRIELLVLDDTGKPIVGAEILVTSELTRFRQTVKTDKRGKAVVSVVDALKDYLFHVEADGYAPVEETLRPKPLDTMHKEFRLRPKGAAAEPSGQTPQSIVPFTPAQLAFNEGVEALRGGQLDAAAAKFRDALEKDPDLVDAWSALAVTLAERQDWLGAIDAAQRVIEAKGADGATYRVLYRAHQALGNAAEAELARTALAELGEGKDSAAFAHNEGVAAVRIGDDATALERFQEAVRLNPELAPPMLGIAVIHLRQGRFQEAAAAAERALELDAESLTGLEVRWQAYRGLGDEEKEKVALEALARRNPAPIVANLLDRGRDLFESGDARGAAAELERAVELDPDQAEIHYRLGLCYVSLEDNAAAKRHLQRFLELAPEHPEAATAREMLGYLK